MLTSFAMQPIQVQCRTVAEVVWVDLAARPVPTALTVYRSRISAFSLYEAYLHSLLHPDEKHRAGRYHQPQDRQRFIVARGLLRLLLSRYVAVAPTDIAFATDATKKPFLKDSPDWHYNVSHSGDWIVMAVAQTGVGVDVEKIEPDFDFGSVTAPLFSREEQRVMNESTNARPLFYELWTRKEALAKATAKGIDDDFCRLPSLAGNHLVNSQLIDTTNNWTVSSFVVADAYVGSVAFVTIPDGPEPVFCTVDDSLFANSPY